VWLNDTFLKELEFKNKKQRIIYYLLTMAKDLQYYFCDQGSSFQHFSKSV